MLFVFTSIEQQFSPQKDIEKKKNTLVCFYAKYMIILFCVYKEQTTSRPPQKYTHHLFYHCGPTLFFLIKSSLT